MLCYSLFILLDTNVILAIINFIKHNAKQQTQGFTTPDLPTVKSMI